MVVLRLYCYVTKACFVPVCVIKTETPFAVHVHSVKDVPAQPFIEAYAAHLKRGGKFRLKPVLFKRVKS